MLKVFKARKTDQQLITFTVSSLPGTFMKTINRSNNPTKTSCLHVQPIRPNHFLELLT